MNAISKQNAAENDGHVYFIQEGDAGPVKIGYAGNPQKRRSTLQTGNSDELNLLLAIPGTRETETSLHAMFAKARKRGEWFDAAVVLPFIADVLAGKGGRSRRYYVPEPGSFEEFVMALSTDYDDEFTDFIMDTRSAAGGRRGLRGVESLSALHAHLVYRCNAPWEVCEIAEALWNRWADQNFIS